MKGVTMPSYNVVCVDCSEVFAPPEKSPLWWRAKQRAEKGYIDALLVRGEECGCISSMKNPDAPYRVFGWDDERREFNVSFTRFSEAVKEYIDASDHGCVVFIKGVSDVVADRLRMR